MNRLTKRFRDLPIKAKVMLVTITASLVALFAVAVGLYIFQLRNFRDTYAAELKTLGRIMADNCATAVAFDDAKTANEVLTPLHVKQEITYAGVLGKRGEEFASFGANEKGTAPKAWDQEQIVERGAMWTVVQPINLDEERIGTFYMHVNFDQPRRKLQELYFRVTAAVLGGSIVIVVLLTMSLQRFIVGPLRLLADASQAIARDRDYSVRVQPSGRDEFGQLTEAFNDMLARIDEQDSALQGAKQTLQSQVEALEIQIAERERAEEALRVSQRKLVETSRLAGMAEVATGVLHNVGNVLNSVNISAGILGEKIRRSKAPKLAKAAALLTSQNGGLVRFLTEDPNGQKLPGYLTKLGEHLIEENTGLIHEVEELGKNIGHIKEVVSMQQSYAKVSGVFEMLPVDQLVEDAISMNYGAFERHRLTVERRFTPAPPARVDRHKVLQILINLIRNAKYALDEVDRDDKCITISIEPAGESVRITVADNGIGIPPENLDRIFGHGFTTRRDGHGFGLHSGANAAREIGGNLTVQSAGTGHGASFTLELPTAAQPSLQ